MSALANFPSILGPGTVAIPGYANATAWAGILAHCAGHNRFGVLEPADSSNSATVVSSFGTITTNASYGMAIEGSLNLPGIVPGTTRTVAGSAAVAALRAQVAATSNQNQAPCGPNWGISYPVSFTEFHGPGGTYLQSDVNAMSSAGINCFAIYAGVPCLFGFVTPVPMTTDITYWQASASCERMALVYDGTQAIAEFLFATLDREQRDADRGHEQAQGVLQDRFGNRALWSPGVVNIGPPINTPTTEAAGQLNANLEVQISPYANTINESITTVPISVSL